MTAWNRCLESAGIQGPELRSAYDAQRRAVRRFRPASYVAARVLLPPAVLPHVVAATAFMHQGDNLLDTGSASQRVTAWEKWEQRVRTALETEECDDPLILALCHTISAYPRLREVVEEYLATATAELEFSGFTSETDYQVYLDSYSLPAFMLVGTLLGPHNDDGRFRSACRTLIDGSQRLDFLNDLAEDLREGRMGIPEEALKRFSLTVDDLAAGHESPELEELVADQVQTARRSLLAAREVTHVAAVPGQALLRAVVEIELLTADAALARGARLLRGPAKPPLWGTLRTLLRARRRAGRHSAPSAR
ncbi:squalene/phytoene synthase family protein [Streptomyces sp. enrichment culture]|uniref:squalene/phytoene synthase family protein n=1 Tax=Streptomyces sp. enrichment culture TaxID=1795815 RepID=UPI003F56CAF6